MAQKRFAKLAGLATGIVVGLSGLTGSAQQEGGQAGKVIFESSFAVEDDRWQMSDPAAWKRDPGGWLSLHIKSSNYQPVHRSPLHLAILKDIACEDFVLDVRIRSTQADYGHRDACLFFGYQDSDHFYYVHLGKQTDDRCNQIFIVNGADRQKISTQTSEGTPWDDQWHQVRIERNYATGDIRVWFDDMQRPVMIANDRTFGRGQIGIGSFDDTADFDDLRITTIPAVEQPEADQDR